MATAPTYCTHRQLKDVFPQVDSFDSKKPIYGWESLGNSIYLANNTGLITQLFADGRELNSIETAATTTAYSFVIDSGVDSQPDGDASKFNELSYTTWLTGSDTDLKPGHYIAGGSASDSEIMFVEAHDTSTNKITVRRGALGSTITGHSTPKTFYSKYAVSEVYNWMYDSYLDQVLLYSSSNPNDTLMQAGEDFSTLITRITANASRYLDSKLDPNLPKEQFKDKEGNYDYIIIRTTALLAATFLIRSHDPTSEVANAFMEDAQSNIDALNKGNAALSWQTTGDSSKGVLRDVTYTSGSIRPVDTRGRWSGSWDLIKIKITTGGVLGTAKYSVFIKDDNKLKNHEAVSNEVITGDYQALAGGLQIRFAGSADDSTAAINDEWEMEVTGWSEEVDNSQINSVKMTRGGYGMYRKTRTFGKY